MLKATLSRAVIKPNAKEYRDDTALHVKTDFVEPETTTGTIVAVHPITWDGKHFIKTDQELVNGIRIWYRNKTLEKNGKPYNPLEFVQDGEKYISIEITDIVGIAEA